MSIQTTELRRQLDLRSRAVSKLSGNSDHAEKQLTASAAFTVLHALASSPSTAADAMALLHELQVHQVEIDLQFEELQRASAELESNLTRQTQLYDFAPVAMFTVDAHTTLVELNLAGARMLGQERPLLLGQGLINYLTAGSKSALQATLERVKADAGVHTCALQLATPGAAPQSVVGSVSADPSDSRFLIALSASAVS